MSERQSRPLVTERPDSPPAIDDVATPAAAGDARRTVEAAATDQDPARSEPPLTVDERREIAQRLSALMTGAGLLALGLAHAAWRPGQEALSASIQAVGALVTVAPIVVRGVRGFLARPTQDLSAQLVTLASLAAMAGGDFITATLVPLLMEGGRLFEERSSRGARAAIDALRHFYERTARVRRDDGEHSIPVEQIRAGETVIVRPGEAIPVDGKVIAGRSSVDQSPITGESQHEVVDVGSPVYSGSLNLDGLLQLEVTGAGEQTVLGRVVESMRRVEEAKVPTLRWVERMSAIYLPAVLTVAAIALFWTGDPSRAIAVLVVACPSALFIAGPAAMVASMTACSKNGVLVKGPGFLEAVPDVQSIVMDKTGTATEGALTVERIHALDSVDEGTVLSWAAICGYGSLHPVARAVYAEAERREVVGEPPTESSEKAGGGVTAHRQGHVFRLGRADWLRDEGVPLGEPPVVGEGTTVYLARNDVVVGALSLSDRPRPEAREALDALRDGGVDRCLLVTGDRDAVARSVATRLGFDDYAAEVLPQQKLDVVHREQERGVRVMVVGDGVNDALAMRGADVAVAVGTRAHDVALQGADIALLQPDLRRLPWMIETARRTRDVVHQNVAIVAGVAVLMVGLASAGIISPLLGAALHNVDALVVLLNSARLLPQNEAEPS